MQSRLTMFEPGFLVAVILCAILGWSRATSLASSSMQLAVRSLLPMFWVGSPVNPWDVGFFLGHLRKPGKSSGSLRKKLP